MKPRRKRSTGGELSVLLMTHALVCYALADGGEAFAVWLDAEVPAGVPAVPVPVVRRCLEVLHGDVDRAIDMTAQDALWECGK